MLLIDLSSHSLVVLIKSCQWLLCSLLPFLFDLHLILFIQLKFLLNGLLSLLESTRLGVLMLELLFLMWSSVVMGALDSLAAQLVNLIGLADLISKGLP